MYPSNKICSSTFNFLSFLRNVR
ncbi:unnamed protein product [Spodoptera exigua]|nr:unnamed protein product [Spodoptera exigua]